jgi:hypothetical protein
MRCIPACSPNGTFSAWTTSRIGRKNLRPVAID